MCYIMCICVYIYIYMYIHIYIYIYIGFSGLSLAKGAERRPSKAADKISRRLAGGKHAIV